MEQKKFEKSLILNVFDQYTIQEMTSRLFQCMEETNKMHGVQTQFLNLRLKYPERDIVGDVRELKLEWSAI